MRNGQARARLHWGQGWAISRLCQLLKGLSLISLSLPDYPMAGTIWRVSRSIPHPEEDVLGHLCRSHQEKQVLPEFVLVPLQPKPSHVGEAKRQDLGKESPLC